MIIIQLIFCDCRTCVGPQMFAMRPHGRLPTAVAGRCVRPYWEKMVMKGPKPDGIGKVVPESDLKRSEVAKYRLP